MLPKRPVSLLRDPNVPVPGASSTTPPNAAVLTAIHTAKPFDDDDDGLEYAENPFDAEPVAGKK